MTNARQPISALTLRLFAVRRLTAPAHTHTQGQLGQQHTKTEENRGR